MFGLTRWTQPSGVSRLRQDVDDLFDRFFGREDWMPSSFTRSIRAFQRDMDQLFGSFFGPDWSPRAEAHGTYWPRLQATMKGGEHVVTAELPGFRPEEIEVSVTGQTLTIQGEHKGEDKDESSYRRVSQSVTLPEAVDPEKVKATLAHGLLEIRVPASPQLAGKKIPIEVGTGEPSRQLKAA
ncbi:MAG: Hsp20/alpha crystallin family protein [Candidatus Methylomirabilales bacterium]